MTALRNPSFEGITEPGEWTRNTHTGTAYGEIYTPVGWTAWWEEGDFRRPEMKVIQNIPPFDEPPRIQDGDWAFQAFTMYGRQHAGLYQVVAGLLPGEIYELSAMAHAWSLHPGIGEQSAFCSSGVGCGAVYIPEGDAPEVDPDNPDNVNDAIGNFTFRVGVSYGDPDPLGAVDWGDGAHIYNVYHEVPPLRFIAPDNGKITIYLRATSLWDFRNSDAYWDNVKIRKVDDNGDTPPPQDCPGSPRIDYERTLVLLPPEADAEWAKAVADGSWDEHRYTISGSADDAGIGKLTDRNVIAVNPGEWPGNLSLEQFFEEYYPGINYTAIEAATPDELRERLSGPFEPDPPGPYPPPLTSNNHVGLHLQTMSENWDGYLAEAKPRVTKVLASMHDVLGALRAYPETKVIWRHVDNDTGNVWGPDPQTGAQNWLRRFRDSLFEISDRVAQEFPHLPEPYFYAECINEHYNSNASDVTHAANIDIEYIKAIEALGLPVRAAVFCAAVGNPHHLYGQYESLLPLARVAAQTGSPFGYHNYWLGNSEYGGPEHLGKYLAFRWAEMDKVFRANGVEVYWYGGESGVVGGESGHNPDGTGWVNLNYLSGWRDCYDGNWSRYEDDFVYVNNWLGQWNAEHEDRYWGLTIFTVGSHFTGWRPFQLDEAQINRLAVVLG